MSSETSTKDGDQLHPWQFFTLAALAAATAVVFVSKENSPAAVILLSLTVGAAAFVGAASLRTFGPLVGVHVKRIATVLGGRSRVALEREKTLVLRAIKDLEFDRAMGKVSESDFDEMSARLRTRAARLIRQLDRGANYRDEIEREVARRVQAAPAAAANRGSRSCTCGTTNDADARFCKSCGQRLHA